MRRIFCLLLLCFLTAALPMQGMAATVMACCAPGSTAPAAADQQADAHAGHHGHQMHEAAAPEKVKQQGAQPAQQDHHDQHIQAGQHSDTAHQSGSCSGSSCFAGVPAVLPSAPARSLRPLIAWHTGVPPQFPADHVSAGAERPPRLG